MVALMAERGSPVLAPMRAENMPWSGPGGELDPAAVMSNALTSDNFIVG